MKQLKLWFTCYNEQPFLALEKKKMFAREKCFKPDSLVFKVFVAITTNATMKYY